MVPFRSAISYTKLEKLFFAAGSFAWILLILRGLLPPSEGVLFAFIGLLVLGVIGLLVGLPGYKAVRSVRLPRWFSTWTNIQGFVLGIVLICAAVFKDVELPSSTIARWLLFGTSLAYLSASLSVQQGIIRTEWNDENTA
ncbi:MAG: hypothetical protein KatS3mg016_0055 [Fimbriimonadales bacterium]|nr:MAG: hypothetical protein KatS3mg016_0055 [Fimbriimonadales bacterium]GIV06954.1 MAG: hypothetical protein KatS3mg017_0156 [Fimbriimonadales bacterium]